jgi:hypothetical protein
MFASSLVSSSVVCLCQGTIYFSNRVPGIVDAPVFDMDGTTRLQGLSWLAQLYAGVPGSDFRSLVPVGAVAPFGTGTNAGYWDANPAPSRTVSFIAPGTDAAIQVRVWSVNDGATLEETVRDKPNAPVALSNLLRVTTGDGANAAPLEGLGPFTWVNASVIPEPSPLLLLLGLPLLLWSGHRPK